MADKKSSDQRLGPIVLPTTPPPAPSLRTVRPLPETCCYSHDANPNQHEVDCITGMIYRIAPTALDVLFEGFTRVIQRQADELAARILAAQTGPAALGATRAAQVHEAITAFNKLRETAVRAQDIIHEREAVR